jgi:hypothetical protein
MNSKGNVRFKKVISHNLTFISTELKTYRQFIMKCNLLLHNEIKVKACFPVMTNVCSQYQQQMQLGADDSSNK